MTQKARAAARPPQTKVKHSILARYLAAWGGIIINGMRYQPKGSLHFVYVDCHASSGTYQGELEDVVERQPTAVVDGSPLIGIKGLDGLKQSAQQAGLSVQVNAILIEEKPARYQALCAAIDQAGFGARLKQTQRFMALQPDDIAVVHADSTTLVRDLVAYTQSEWRYALYLLDPYGPKGIPMSFVRYIVPLPRHDVMINMPYQDLHKKSGMARKDELTRSEYTLLSHYNAMFGSDQWQGIVDRLTSDPLWRPDNRAGDASVPYFLPGTDALMTEQRDLETALMDCYREALQHCDPTMAVKSLGLHFPDRERTMFYLYLTTHDANGALAMNKELWEAGYAEHELRTRLRQLKTAPPPEQLALSLFDEPVSVTPPPRERPSSEAIQRAVLKVCAGRTLDRKAVYTMLADDVFFASEIDQALRQLRKAGAVLFTGNLTNRTVLRFLERD